MAKRQPAFNPAQLGFDFDPPPAAVEESALRGLDKATSSAVARILKEDPRNRFSIAAACSELLDDEVTKLMLDAYASEARENHNIPFARFLALVAATQRYDVLDALVRQVGCGVLVGEEIHLAEIGHLESQRRDIEKRLKALKGTASPLDRRGRR